jgi:hypothetical protein
MISPADRPGIRHFDEAKQSATEHGSPAESTAADQISKIARTEHGMR